MGRRICGNLASLARSRTEPASPGLGARRKETSGGRQSENASSRRRLSAVCQSSLCDDLAGRRSDRRGSDQRRRGSDHTGFSGRSPWTSSTGECSTAISWCPPATRWTRLVARRALRPTANRKLLSACRNAVVSAFRRTGLRTHENGFSGSGPYSRCRAAAWFSAGSDGASPVRSCRRV